MPTYSGTQKEETLKSLVHQDYFPKFGYEPNIDNIDFVITDPKTRGDLWSDGGAGASKHYLWAEAKKGTHDVFDMFTQLILTCKKTYEKGEHLAPPWLGCFDEARIAFVSFHDMLPIFTETDFNWNTTPSNHETADFQKARNKIEKLVGAKIAVYNFGGDDREIKEFIKTHFVAGASSSVKSPITKDNFVQIFIKWVKEVEPSIDVKKDEWAEYKKRGILDCDFYRADLMSEGGNTITEKLKIVLKNDNYRFQEKNSFGRLSFSDIGFTDGGTTYSRFWARYERPPALEFRQHIIDRRDLLVPQNIREVKGSFFTPKIWADKSKEYLAAVFGDNWQDEYYVWDCAAGTGNLLAGLTNEYNVWASDVDQGNIETMQSLIDIDENLNLLSGHVFQFDFLNDSFDKLPLELKKIIVDPEKRKKLIVYINPPYAEATSGIGKGASKAEVATLHKTKEKYAETIGAATNEVFAQFMFRVYFEIKGCKLALFSTLKLITSQVFVKFRENFKADFQGGFICPANTFDNVEGKFPIGFTVWNLQEGTFPENIDLDIVGTTDTKDLSTYKNVKLINNWIVHFAAASNAVQIGYFVYLGTDFQNSQQTRISSIKPIGHQSCIGISKTAVFEPCIYFAVRHVFEHTWLNHNDQFLHPNDGYKNDIEFQNNCLAFALFHGKNYISAKYGINHWIPFSEKEVGAQEKFESAFMSGFLADKTFSAEAAAVLDAGRELWRYYHAITKDNKTMSHNASLYDIREYFQGRNKNGRMNNSSDDVRYTELIGNLRGALKTLTLKIQPKVYEYGFLKE